MTCLLCVNSIGKHGISCNKGYGQEIFAECYQDARQDGATETQLKVSVFPDECPFNLEVVLGVDYLANEE